MVKISHKTKCAKANKGPKNSVVARSAMGILKAKTVKVQPEKKRVPISTV